MCTKIEKRNELTNNTSPNSYPHRGHLLVLSSSRIETRRPPGYSHSKHKTLPISDLTPLVFINMGPL